MKQLAQIKSIIVISVAVIAIGTAIYFLGRKKGRAKFNNVDLPDQTKWGKELTTQEAATVRRISKALYSDMKGLRFIKPFDIDTWREYAGLDDRLFVAVYNDFGDNYSKDGNGSLYDWFSEEWTAGSAKLNELKSQILGRMEKLGLL